MHNRVNISMQLVLVCLLKMVKSEHWLHSTNKTEFRFHRNCLRLKSVKQIFNMLQSFILFLGIFDPILVDHSVKRLQIKWVWEFTSHYFLIFCIQQKPKNGLSMIQSVGSLQSRQLILYSFPLFLIFMIEYLDNHGSKCFAI